VPGTHGTPPGAILASNERDQRCRSNSDFALEYLVRVDQLLHHEVEGRVDGLVDEVEELKRNQAEVVDKLVNEMVKEVTELTKQIEALMNSLTSPWSSLNSCKPASYYHRSSRNVNVNNDRVTWWNTQVQTRGQEAAVSMTWEDFKALMKEELCPNNEMQKLESEFWCHAMVGAGHDGGSTEPTTIQSDILKVEVLTDEAIRNGSLKKNSEKRGNSGEPSKDGNAKGDNERSKTRRAFSTTTNPVRKEYTGSAPKWPRMMTLLNARNQTAVGEACFECDGTDHYKSACPRLNREPRQGGNRSNQDVAIEGGQSRGYNGNSTREREFVMGAEEAR
nr:reverse transcriptase domain-containing protein [Tanacetum cinerariifolium]